MSLAEVRRGGRQRLGGKGSGASPVRQVRLSDDLNAQLEAAAAAEGKSASEVMREALQERLRAFHGLAVDEDVYFTDDPAVVYDVMLESLYALKGQFLIMVSNAPSQELADYWYQRVQDVLAEKRLLPVDDVARLREATLRWNQLRTDLANSLGN